MAKEHILLSKQKYEELLAPKPLVQQNEGEDLKKRDTFTQTGNGLFVEKVNDNFNDTPGILDHSIKLKKRQSKSVK